MTWTYEVSGRENPASPINPRRGRLMGGLEFFSGHGTFYAMGTP